MKTESRIENGYKKIINFELDKAEMDQHRKASFDRFKKSAKIDGFRDGKAPESMIRSRFGAKIEVEAMNDAINDSYRNFIIENKTYPLSEPVIDNVEQNEEKLTFTATFETYPEFELKSYSGITIEQDRVVVTDKDIDDAVNEILEKHSSSKEVNEPVADGHVVDVSIKPLNIPDAKWENQTIELGKNPDDTFDKEIIGMKKGEVKTINLNPPNTPDQTFELEIRIDKIGEKVLPELNDDFAKAYDSKFATVEDLKNDLRKNIESSKQNSQELEIFDKLAKKIIDAHDNFEVPPSILNKYLEDLVVNAQKQYGKNIDKNMLRDVYKQNAEISLKWEYIRHNIIEAEKLSISDEDVNAKITEISQERSIDAEKIHKYYSSKEKKQMLKDDLLDKKLRSFLKEKNTINLVEPSIFTEEAEK